MALLRINAHGEHPVPAHGPVPLNQQLATALGGTGPVIIMVHGFKFSPFEPSACPHRHIFALSTYGAKQRSWPTGLGFSGHSSEEGTCIAFGWHARGWIWQAVRQSHKAARALARLVRQVSRVAPQRPIHLVGHSLGARLCLRALSYLERGDVARVLLLSAAAFRNEAQHSLRTDAGRSAEFINITSRENRLYDLTFKALLRPHLPISAPLRAGLRNQPNWVDIPIDRLTTQTHLATLGYALGPGLCRMCHWSTYTRAGIFALYRDLLRAQPPVPLSQLRTTARARSRHPLLPSRATLSS